MKLEVKDLDAVEAACKEMGLTFHRGKKTFKALEPVNFTQIEKPCDHAISHPSWIYEGFKTSVEVGLKRTATGYSLICDEEIQNGFTSRWLTLGQNAGKFMQLYGVHAATLKAEEMGYEVSRCFGTDGTINLEITGQPLYAHY
jgi:hypothetical protein